MWRKSRKVNSPLKINVFCPPTGTKLTQSEKKKRPPKGCSYQVDVSSGLKDKRGQKTCHQPNVAKMKLNTHKHPHTHVWQGYLITCHMDIWQDALVSPLCVLQPFLHVCPNLHLHSFSASPFKVDINLVHIYLSMWFYLLFPAFFPAGLLSPFHQPFTPLVSASILCVTLWAFSHRLFIIQPCNHPQVIGSQQFSPR